MTVDAVDSAQSAVREGQRSRPFRIAAKSGYAMTGLLHVIIGVIAIVIAFGGDGGGQQASQTGALDQLAQAPGGFVAIAVVAVGLLALGLWQLAEAFTASGKDAAERWKNRLKDAGKGVGYLAIAALAFGSLLRGGRSSGGEASTKSLSAQVLAVPGGVFLIGAIGLAVLGGGVFFVVRGIRGTFQKDLAEPAAARPLVRIVGAVGYIAKGLALGVLGVLLVIAALTSDAEEAGGLDSALRALATLPFGQVLLTAVGVGFIAYGAYCGLRARWARL